MEKMDFFLRKLVLILLLNFCWESPTEHNKYYARIKLKRETQTEQIKAKLCELYLLNLAFKNKLIMHTHSNNNKQTHILFRIIIMTYYIIIGDDDISEIN